MRCKIYAFRFILEESSVCCDCPTNWHQWQANQHGDLSSSELQQSKWKFFHQLQNLQSKIYHSRLISELEFCSKRRITWILWHMRANVYKEILNPTVEKGHSSVVELQECIWISNSGFPSKLNLYKHEGSQRPLKSWFWSVRHHPFNVQTEWRDKFPSQSVYRGCRQVQVNGCLKMSIFNIYLLTFVHSFSIVRKLEDGM